MNTREREVMDALALAARRMLAWIDDRGMGCNAECGNPECKTKTLRSSVAAYDALLAEGSASSEGAEAVGFVDEDGDRVLAWRHNGREIAVTFGETPSVMATDEQGKLWFASGDTHPQPAQGEHEQPALERYGIEWRGPHMPIALPMPDGYWTPWHIAEAALKEREHERRSCEGSERRQSAIEDAFYEAQGDIFTTETRWGEVSAWIAARAEEQRTSERRPIAESDVSRACEVFDAATFYSIGGYTFDDYRKRMRAALESALPRGLPSGSDAVRQAWRAAITLANNICVQESDRENDNDGDTGWIDGTAECAKRIREFVEPADAQLVEMLTENGAAAAASALATAEQPSCGQDARDAPKHGDDAGDGMRYIMCKVGFGEHYSRWLLIPHADGQYVTAAKLEPFSMSILEHQLIAAQQRQGGAK